ncbi:hypothetical protein HOU72_gp07 [Pectobacterium phage Khlen]|uniref:Scaffolding protein n=1 Tax=Pectobacterium phage Khlen TaxID=2489627 RepID=A0A3G8FIA2_9CAUD|nr:hypothetical protein HOU72_gp07 [Pectobacterium phage Khlen]AZF94538.1 hypothetical protein [Pectobacterium phage Khlen]
MTDVTTVDTSGTLAPSGANPFGTVQQGQVVPQTPAEKAPDLTTSKLDQILAAVREGRTADAGKVIDEAAQERTPAKEPPKAEAAPVVTPDAPKVATGNKALDIAVSAFVSATGTTEEDISKAMAAAYEAGDVAYIDKAYLRERFGDKADQAIALAEAVYEADTTAQAALIQDVYSAAGTKEQFEQCAEVFKQHAKPAMRSVVKSMLDSGDPVAVREAASLIAEFGKQSGVIVQKDGTRQGGSSGVVPDQGLSKEEFQAARMKLNPMSRTYQADMAKLIDLRRMGKQLNK